MEDFADYLYRTRTRRRKYLSQQKLSKMSGYSQSYLSLIETGKMKPSERCKRILSKVLKRDKSFIQVFSQTRVNKEMKK